MYRIDSPDSVPSAPTPAALGTEGFFKDGSTGGGDGTILPADFGNMLQETLLHLIDDQGIAHSKTLYDGLTLAIVSKISEQIKDAANQGDTTNRGALELATQGEVDAANDNTRAITPQKLGNALEVGWNGFSGYLWIKPADLLFNFVHASSPANGALITLEKAYALVADYEIYSCHFHPTGSNAWARWTASSATQVQINRSDAGMDIFGIAIGTLA